MSLLRFEHSGKALRPRARAAEALVATHPLRTLDAIHVTSAQLFFARMPAPPLFLSADRRQTDVAGAVGLTARFIA